MEQTQGKRTILIDDKTTVIIKNGTQEEIERLQEQLEDAQAEIGTLKVKLEVKEVENENLKLKADYEALRASNLEKELNAVKIENEKKLQFCFPTSAVLRHIRKL